MNRAERSIRAAVPVGRSGLSLRSYLILLVVSVLVPILFFAGAVFVRYYDSELSRIEISLLDDARRLAQTIDQDHRGLTATLQTFAISRLISRGDYEGAYYRALRDSRNYRCRHPGARRGDRQSDAQHPRSLWNAAAHRGGGRRRRSAANHATLYLRRDHGCGGAPAALYDYSPRIRRRGTSHSFSAFQSRDADPRRFDAQEFGARTGRRHLRPQFQICRADCGRR